MAQLETILRRETGEFEVELGAPVRFLSYDPAEGRRFLIGPAAGNRAIERYRIPDGQTGVWYTSDRQVLVADGPDLDAVIEALSLLRTLRMTGAHAVVQANCAGRAEVIDRIRAEVGWTFPSFGLHNLDWEAICRRHDERVREASNPLPALQCWLAELHDAHTWVRPVPGHVPLPYVVEVRGDAAVMVRVPEQTAAYEAGVRPGDRLLDEDPAGWRQRTGAPPHARSLIAGRRLLSGPIGQVRRLSVASTQGGVLMWEEAPVSGLYPFPLVRWTRLASGTGYLRIEAWLANSGIEQAIDVALAELRPAGRLILDLRANPGGNATLALAVRDRFVHQPSVMGTVRFSDGPDSLAGPEIIRADPAPEEKRWPGPVHVLTDPLTYSASEDFLLGLQGMPHVQVVGEPSGGGSGRARTLRLEPGAVLTVSTCLTYDRTGRCIEGSGIPVDVPVPSQRGVRDAPDTVLLTADRDW